LNPASVTRRGAKVLPGFSSLADGIRDAFRLMPGKGVGRRVGRLISQEFRDDPETDQSNLHRAIAGPVLWESACPGPAARVDIDSCQDEMSNYSIE
jgi:hypothetical protein